MYPDKPVIHWHSQACLPSLPCITQCKHTMCCKDKEGMDTRHGAQQGVAWRAHTAHEK
jgi:hypothetical protein